MEIDCLSCHATATAFDGPERAAQIARGNLRAAPTAAAGLGVVRARTATAPVLSAAAATQPATIEYDKAQFDANDRVLFRMTKTPPADRCYFCHTTRPVGPGAGPAWQQDRDVHLSAGLTCADCHRHGLDHRMVRGYEGEPGDARLTCRSCDLGETAGAMPQRLAGRLRAPTPRHAGLPPLHLDKLTCTACHSGPWPVFDPEAQTRRAAVAARMQTSRAHGLGIGSTDRTADTPPLVYGPVFVRQADGKIAACLATWPAYWGWMEHGIITPIPIDQVLQAAGRFFTRRPSRESLGKIAQALQDGGRTDAAGPARKAEVVHYEGGEVWVWRDGKFVDLGYDPPSARPLTWPLAHDVRPAKRSLGANDCTDCHAGDAPIFFGGVPGPSAVFGATPAVPLRELTSLDTQYHRWLARSFALRPLLTAIGFAASGVVALVLLRYGLLALGAVLRAGAGRKGPV